MTIWRSSTPGPWKRRYIRPATDVRVEIRGREENNIPHLPRRVRPPACPSGDSRYSRTGLCHDNGRDLRISWLHSKEEVFRELRDPCCVLLLEVACYEEFCQGFVATDRDSGDYKCDFKAQEIGWRFIRHLVTILSHTILSYLSTNQLLVPFVVHFSNILSPNKTCLSDRVQASSWLNCTFTDASPILSLTIL